MRESCAILLKNVNNSFCNYSSYSFVLQLLAYDILRFISSISFIYMPISRLQLFMQTRTFMNLKNGIQAKNHSTCWIS